MVSNGRLRKRESGPGHALLQIVRLNGMNAAKPAIEFGILHHRQNIGVHHGVNDEQIQGVKIVVAK